MRVGCRWISHLSTTLCVASVVGVDDSEILCKDWPVGKHGSSCESGCRPLLLALRWIIHIFTNSYESRAALRFLLASHFFLLSLHPSKSLPPFWSRCTVIPLPSHLLHPHAHLLSVSRWATFWSRERSTDEKESLFFNHTPLWSHPHFQSPRFIFCLQNLHCANAADVSLMHFMCKYREWAITDWRNLTKCFIALWLFSAVIRAFVHSVWD